MSSTLGRHAGAGAVWRLWPHGSNLRTKHGEQGRSYGVLPSYFEHLTRPPPLCYLYPTCPLAQPDSAVPAQHLPIHLSRPGMNSRKKASKASYQPTLARRNYRVRTICSENGVLNDILIVDPRLPRYALDHKLSLRPPDLSRCHGKPQSQILSTAQSTEKVSMPTRKSPPFRITTRNVISLIIIKRMFPILVSCNASSCMRVGCGSGMEMHGHPVLEAHCSCTLARSAL